GRKLVTPDGIAWTIKRRWMPHRKVRWRRLRRHRPPEARQQKDHWYTDLLDFFDIPDLGGLGDLGTVILVIVGIVVAGLLLWFVMIPALLFLIDVVVLLVLLFAGVVEHV
ncbi:MAG TPA: hypothetical protein VF942_04600, partial [Acidimicrobiales bacterium]